MIRTLLFTAAIILLGYILLLKAADFAIEDLPTVESDR